MKLKPLSTAGYLAMSLAFVLSATMPVMVAADEPSEADEAVTSEESAPEPVGMNRPMDGSNIEKFEASLAQVKTEITEAQYTTLGNALSYLLVYDLSAKRNLERLYKNLDGKTPAQILDMVKWRTGD